MSQRSDPEELSCFHLIPFGPLHGKNREFPFQPRVTTAIENPPRRHPKRFDRGLSVGLPPTVPDI